ncbi:DeoR/GlpR family DNA-binding transcription regulator [Streptomyces sp. DSM 44915]|uniref:DeoR/GlpR family DNA-binding transcription regulator n=1 Tax=Streptomyces chisholmiae TaxID=3075540 RepID=A0ABU2JRD1_9ACTN|nr:DeoR/GlpR family DNA-binding transcription regulator [Streptomyces sp. DSM 44915]MDT0267535.1 DeoR/GlpR family DNA-binding transcription regulator [Streptomyces sp. DSM 44915]
MALSATERRRSAIVDLATFSGLASVEELSRRFGVTPSTIRRDLAKLTAEGRITRTYGGAAPAARHGHVESSLRQRLGEAHEAKRAIGRLAAAQVAPGDALLLDTGSTVGALADELTEAEDVTVTTVSLTVLDALADAEGVTLQCLGGRLRPASQGFVGPLAEAALERISADIVFLGTDGVSATGEICEADLVQTRLKELMIRRGGRVFVLAHGSKIGAAPFHAWLRVPVPWTLVTDATASTHCLDSLREHGVEVVVADA